MKHIAHEREENMRGVIIGGSYVGWQVVYAGRPQSGKEYCDTEAEAMDAARARIAGLQAAHCGHPCYLYAEEKWEIRIWG